LKLRGTSVVSRRRTSLRQEVSTVIDKEVKKLRHLIGREKQERGRETTNIRQEMASVFHQNSGLKNHIVQMNVMVAHVNKDFSTLRQECTSHNKEFSTLKGQVIDHEKTIAMVRLDIAGLKNQVAQQEVSALKGQVIDHEKAIATVRLDIASLKNQVAQQEATRDIDKGTSIASSMEWMQRMETRFEDETKDMECRLNSSFRHASLLDGSIFVAQVVASYILLIILLDFVLKCVKALSDRYRSSGD
jgi:chromosome segregation ATPase